MKTAEAKTLRHGDLVKFYNGKHTIRGVVAHVGADRNGLWVHVAWTDSKGNAQASQKRPAAVDKDEAARVSLHARFVIGQYTRRRTEPLYVTASRSAKAR
jgi:hypothetical protein